MMPLSVSDFWGFEAGPIVAVIVLVAISVLALLTARTFVRKL